MRTRLAFLSAASVVALSLAACGTEGDGAANEVNTADVEVINETDTSTAAAGGDGTATTGSDWPAGTRIVSENGVTYRIERGGARIALGPADSRIVVEGGNRFRVDPDGTRVRINDQGAVIDVDDDGVGATVNLGGNTSVQVNTD